MKQRLSRLGSLLAILFLCGLSSGCVEGLRPQLGSTPTLSRQERYARIGRNLPINLIFPPTFVHSGLMGFTPPGAPMILSGNEIWPPAESDCRAAGKFGTGTAW